MLKDWRSTRACGFERASAISVRPEKASPPLCGHREAMLATGCEVALDYRVKGPEKHSGLWLRQGQRHLGQA